MSITHVDTNFGTPNTGSSPGVTSTSVVTKPSGLAVGDVMVAFVTANKAGITAPSVRWTRLFQSDSAANQWRAEVWYCVSTSSETAASSFTWTNGDNQSPMYAAIAAYRGVNQTNPINASNSTLTTTANPGTGPSITTTASSLILNYRTIRNSSGTSTFSCSVTNERFDNGNNGTVGYFGAMYDSGSESAAGTISGASITRSGGTQTDGFSATIALATGNVSVTPGTAAVTVAANNATGASGVAVNAGKASVTVALSNPSALSGRVVPAGAAAVTVAVRQPAHNAPAGTATVTTANLFGHGYFGAPAYRTKTVDPDTYQDRAGAAPRTITVEQN